MYARLSVAIAALLTVLTLQASAQAPATRDYLSELSAPRPSVLPDGRTVISMDATVGDLRGLLTLTLAGDAGTWAFSATYLEDLRADGTPIPASDHFAHDHDDPSTPGVHREFAHIRRDGVITGTVTSAVLQRTADGVVTGIETADLLVTGGSRTFTARTGSGRIGPRAELPGALTLYLSF
jgi:hypothetical protein